VKPLVATRFDERGGVVSPDGRWLAYESDRSGAYEIWVQPFPALDGAWQASTAGGAQPLWAPNSSELFYRAPDGALMAVAWEVRDSAWIPRATTRVVQGKYSRGGVGTTVRQYDVTRDGQRFLVMKDEPHDTDDAPLINVVQNWTQELKRVVPVP
jgi:serine/threonine-protein kinase